MAGDQPHNDVPGDLGVDEVVAGLQDQIDALTSTVESHQLLFERLRAQGLLPGDGDAGPG